MTVHISSRFDSGAIEVVSAAQADDIHVRIPQDNAAAFAQWFHFRVQGVAGVPCRIVFDNAGQTSYPRGWENYRAVASYDRVTWFRVPTSYDGRVMTVAFTPAHDSVYLAYFEPYSDERHLALVGTAQNSPLARTRSLGRTVDGRDMTDRRRAVNRRLRQRVEEELAHGRARHFASLALRQRGYDADLLGLKLRWQCLSSVLV